MAGSVDELSVFQSNARGGPEAATRVRRWEKNEFLTRVKQSGTIGNDSMAVSGCFLPRRKLAFFFFSLVILIKNHSCLAAEQPDDSRRNETREVLPEMIRTQRRSLEKNKIEYLAFELIPDAAGMDKDHEAALKELKVSAAVLLGVLRPSETSLFDDLKQAASQLSSEIVETFSFQLKQMASTRHLEAKVENASDEIQQAWENSTHGPSQIKENFRTWFRFWEPYWKCLIRNPFILREVFDESDVFSKNVFLSSIKKSKPPHEKESYGPYAAIEEEVDADHTNPDGPKYVKQYKTGMLPFPGFENPPIQGGNKRVGHYLISGQTTAGDTQRRKAVFWAVSGIFVMLLVAGVISARFLLRHWSRPAKQRIGAEKK